MTVKSSMKGKEVSLLGNPRQGGLDCVDEEEDIGPPDAIALPSIHTVRNKGFSGVAFHTKRYGAAANKGKIEKQKFIPVNHFITAKPVNLMINGSDPVDEQALEELYEIYQREMDEINAGHPLSPQRKFNLFG